MFAEGRDDRIVHRGLDEAFACQDRLQRAPAKPSLLSRVRAWFATTARAFAHRGVAHQPAAPPVMPRQSQ
jgi:hypothetical protein